MDVEDIYYCPKCKSNFICTASELSLYKYKNELFRMIQCRHCNKLLIAKTKRITWDDLDVNINDMDIQAHKVANIIIERIHDQGYTEKDSEQMLEDELFEYIMEKLGFEYTNRYMYEIKVIIQKCLAYKFNTPSYKLESYIVNENLEKDMEYLGLIGW